MSSKFEGLTFLGIAEKVELENGVDSEIAQTRLLAGVATGMERVVSEVDRVRSSLRDIWSSTNDIKNHTYTITQKWETIESSLNEALGNTNDNLCKIIELLTPKPKEKRQWVQKTVTFFKKYYKEIIIGALIMITLWQI